MLITPSNKRGSGNSAHMRILYAQTGTHDFSTYHAIEQKRLRQFCAYAHTICEDWNTRFQFLSHHRPKEAQAILRICSYYMRRLEHTISVLITPSNKRGSGNSAHMRILYAQTGTHDFSTYHTIEQKRLRQFCAYAHTICADWNTRFQYLSRHRTKEAQAILRICSYYMRRLEHEISVLITPSNKRGSGNSAHMRILYVQTKTRDFSTYHAIEQKEAQAILRICAYYMCRLKHEISVLITPSNKRGSGNSAHMRILYAQTGTHDFSTYHAIEQKRLRQFCAYAHTICADWNTRFQYLSHH